MAESRENLKNGVAKSMEGSIIDQEAASSPVDIEDLRNRSTRRQHDHSDQSRDHASGDQATAPSLLIKNSKHEDHCPNGCSDNDGRERAGCAEDGHDAELGQVATSRGSADSLGECEQQATEEKVCGVLLHPR